MNTQEMVESVRWKVTEPAEANVSNDRIVAVLNEAQDHVSGYIRELDQKFFTTSALLDTVAAQDYIALPTDMYANGMLLLEDRRGVGATERGPKVPIVYLHELDEITTYATLSPPTPNPAFLIGIRLYFLTPFGETATGAYRFWYEKLLDTLVVTLPTPSTGYTITCQIPREYHPLVVSWAVLNYFAKVEDDHRVWDRIYSEQLSRMRSELSKRQRQQSRRVRIAPDLVGADHYYG